MARNERIQNLETFLQDAQDKLNSANARFELQMQAVRERMAQAQAQRTQVMGGALNLGSRIARPLRGGGGQDPAGLVKSPEAKRTSWFVSSHLRGKREGSSRLTGS